MKLMKQFATWFVLTTRLSRHKSRRDNNSIRFYSTMADIIRDGKPEPARMDGGWHLKRSIIPRIKFCSPNIVRLLRMPEFVFID